MIGKRFIRKLKLQNFLSYSSEEKAIELQPLNVLIGANASGKSNLIEAISILKATPTYLLVPIRQGGGINDFLWKGDKNSPIAQIETLLENPKGMPIRYRLNFTAVSDRLEVLKEIIEDENTSEEALGYFLYNYQNDNYFFNIRVLNEDNEYVRKYVAYPKGSFIKSQSILSQVKDFNTYPELSYIGEQFSSISLYRDWHIGRNSLARMPQKTDLPEHPLLEDGSNLGLVLNNLQYNIGSRELIDRLRKFYEQAEELIVRVYGGTVQIFIREQGLTQPTPANRLSDGTLHYLFLLALLLDPTPPPLICIEEPEIGLHPDILPIIAELLIEASQRTQLIVTTHSDALISALPPESVLVCERDDLGTHLRRLDPERLKKWLEDYSLGDIWRMGEIGGNR